MKPQPENDVEDRTLYCAVIRIPAPGSHRKRKRIYSYWTLRYTHEGAEEAAHDIYRKKDILRIVPVKLVEVE